MDTITHIPHFKEDLSVLGPDLEQGVKVTCCRGHPKGVKVVLFEGFSFPGSTKDLLYQYRQ